LLSCIEFLSLLFAVIPAGGALLLAMHDKPYAQLHGSTGPIPPLF
jgi:hypothetical protein